MRRRLSAATLGAAVVAGALAVTCCGAPELDRAPPGVELPGVGVPGVSAPGRPPAPEPVGRWVPRPGTTWQIQLSGPVDTSVDAQVYDLDVDIDGRVVDTLRRAGRRVICYVNTGAAEDFRADRLRFPDSILGKGNGWPGERWVDIRRIDILIPIMAKRFDECRAKNFDGVDADLVDAYANDTGLPLTGEHQLAYNRMLAVLAHDRGLSIGLKNDLGQISDLVGEFDFSVSESCVRYRECAALTPFVRAAKAVFHIEYQSDNRFCSDVAGLGFSSLRKRKNLDAGRWPC